MKNNDPMAEENKKEETMSDEPLLPSPTVEELKEMLIAAETDRDEYRAGWQRSKADFLNYKKEEAKQLQDIAKYATEDLIKDLISVLDNFDLGLRTLEKSGPVEKGVYLIRTQIDDILKKRGLEKMSVKPGDMFDPGIAEALSEVDAEQPPGTIVQEIEPGYKLHDKVLRPARVIVQK